MSGSNESPGCRPRLGDNIRRGDWRNTVQNGIPFWHVYVLTLSKNGKLEEGYCAMQGKKYGVCMAEYAHSTRGGVLRGEVCSRGKG